MLVASAHLFRWAKDARLPAPSLFRQLAQEWRSLTKREVDPRSERVAGRKAGYLVYRSKARSSLRRPDRRRR